LDATLAVEPKQPIRATQTTGLVGNGSSKISDRQPVLYFLSKSSFYLNLPDTGHIAPNQKVLLDL
jgi:hypothetical protein